MTKSQEIDTQITDQEILDAKNSVYGEYVTLYESVIHAQTTKCAAYIENINSAKTKLKERIYTKKLNRERKILHAASLKYYNVVKLGAKATKTYTTDATSGINGNTLTSPGVEFK